MLRRLVLLSRNSPYTQQQQGWDYETWDQQIWSEDNIRNLGKISNQNIFPKRLKINTKYLIIDYSWKKQMRKFALMKILF